MKLKKGLIIFIIFVLILGFSTTCLAVKDSEKTNNENKVATSSDLEDEITKFEEELKSNNKLTSRVSRAKVINEDVLSLDSESDVEYSNVTVNGNMFIINSDKITLNSVKVNGDVIAIADIIEIKNSRIDGSIYTVGENVDIINSELKSVYAGGQTIKVDEDTAISRELKCCGETVEVNAEVERNAYLFAKDVIIGDKATILGETIVRSEDKDISDNAEIEDLDYDKADAKINVGIKLNTTGNKFITYIVGKGTQIAIILVIAIFVLYGFPKFSEVNSCLRIRNFLANFFGGLLEIFVVFLIAIILMCTGYGIGYGLLLLNLLITFILLGKVIFIISLAIRLSCEPENNSKVKAFFGVVLVALVLAFVEAISLLGEAGLGIDIVLNIVLAITGFGSLFKVILTSKKKLQILAFQKSKKTVQTNFVEPVKNEVKNEVTVEEKVEKNDEAIKAEIINEVKEEIKEEVQELKKENEEEKKQEDKTEENENK